MELTIPPSQEVSAGSTDALCRAVKRLQTYSSASSAEQEAAAGASELRADQEASSPLAAGAFTSYGAQHAPPPVGSFLQAHQKAHEDTVEDRDLEAAAKSSAEDPTGSTEATELHTAAKPLHKQGYAAGQGGTERDSVAQPRTPVREEAYSPVAKGFRLGTLASDPPSSDNYALLYEEANTMLKNLHFARLQRRAQSAVL